MENPERKREYDRFYYELHADEIAERHRRWYRANREHVLKRAKAYREAHPVDCKTDTYRKAERARWRRRMSLPGAREKRCEQQRERRAIHAGHGWLYE